MAQRYNQHVEFHNVEELCPDEVNFLREKQKLADKIKLRFSIGTFYRLLAKKIFGGGKMIYLDADIIVNLDIAELWQQDLQGHPIAAVPEIEATLNRMIKDKFVLHAGIVKMDNYFCAGVMIFDLDKLDENFFRAGVQFLIDNPQCESNDQDILNAFFSENYFKLPQKFDAFVVSERYWKVSVRKKIYHYAGLNIGLDSNEDYNRLWFESFAKTPWFNTDRFVTEIYKRQNKYVSLMQIMMRLSAEHKRAFFIHTDDLPKAKILFEIQDNEPIVEIRDANSLDELLTKMNELRGRKIFFIFYSDWMSMHKFLTLHGFKEFEDFINGEYFLTREQGGKSLPEYDTILNM